MRRIAMYVYMRVVYVADRWGIEMCIVNCIWISAEDEHIVECVDFVI